MTTTLNFTKILSKRAGLLTATLLTSCAVGPNFHMPSAPQGAGYSTGALPAHTASAPGPDGAAQSFALGQDISGQWWTLFHSPQLDAIVKQAMAANPSLEAAQATLREAQENELAQEGSFLPSIGFGVSDSRNLTPLHSLAPVAASDKAYYSLFTGEVSASYSPDVFGLNRRTAESYGAQADLQRDQLEAAYLTITSNVVMSAIQEAGLRAEIKAQQDVIAADQQLCGIIQHQVAVGEVAQSTLLQQQAVLAQAQQMLPPLIKQLGMEDDALKALAGGFPNSTMATDFDLTSLQLPQSLPVSLPSTLVAQRPDVLAASANMNAASAEVGVAIANRLPQFQLSAILGTEPNSALNAFTPYNQFFNLAAGLATPIFEGGTLLHRQRAAVAALDASTAQYRQTVITAFQNVADVLRALQADADTLNAAETAETAASKSLSIAQAQLQQGDIDYYGVLMAEQTYQQTHLALVQAEMMRLSDTVALFQALGGGWWNRADAAPNQDTLLSVG